MALGWLRPHSEISDAERQHGLRLIVVDGVATEAMGALTGGAFLVAYALALGASNTIIGLIAAIAPLTKILQWPASILVERLRQRKLLVVGGVLARRLTWLGIAALPWLLPAPLRVPGLLAALVVYYGVGSVSSCAFSSWMRDLVPDAGIGRFFASRMAAATAASAVLTIAAAASVDRLAIAWGDPVFAYSGIFVAGTAIGLAGIAVLARVPEPRMPTTPNVPPLRLLVEPIRDTNFRRLLAFLGTWAFAINIAAPFFTVYMLHVLKLSIAWIVVLGAISQIVNVASLRLWGTLADKLGNRGVLSFAGLSFVVCISLWPFTTLPDPHPFTPALLVAIHVLAGISTAGVSLCSTGIAVKLAPRGRATSYLATNALITGIAATVAPILAGIAADRLSGEMVTLRFTWLSHGLTRVELMPMSLGGLDFLFLTAAAIGLYSLHRLLAVNEAGIADRSLAPAIAYAEVREALRHVSNVAGLRHLVYFPFNVLRGGPQTDAPQPPDSAPPPREDEG